MITSDNLVDVHGLSRQFGSTQALDDVQIQVPRGTVFGLVGANGAGKTTLIKHIMGLLRPQQGVVRVFRQDPVTHPVEVLSRIGYLSEVNELPDWMRVRDLIQYTRAFYPNWDDKYAQSLHTSFELEDKKRVKTMSKGQRARLGLLLALAHSPEMLVLDEPSSGLDPLVRRDIVRAIIRTISEDGRTVLFSSHLLDEVERVADYLAIIKSGRIVRCGALEDIKNDFHSVSIRLRDSLAEQPDLGNVRLWRGQGQNWSAVVEGDLGKFKHAVEQVGGEIISQATSSLNEIFVSLVGKENMSLEAEL